MKQKFHIAVLLAALLLIVAFAPNGQLRRAADYFFEVGLGDVLNTGSRLTFGRNADVDSATAEDVWDGGSTWSAPTEAQLHEIVSNSATDASDSTGARTMQIYGLDADGDEINETVSLSGTNTVTTTNQYTIIYEMIVRTAGVSATNQGTISATAVPTDSTVTAQINANNNQTHMAIYQVPTGKTGCVVGVYGSMNGGTITGTADVYLYAEPDGEVFQAKRIDGIVGPGTSRFEHNYKIPICFDALTTIKMAAAVSADNTDISAGFDMVLLDR